MKEIEMPLRIGYDKVVLIGLGIDNLELEKLEAARYKYVHEYRTDVNTTLDPKNAIWVSSSDMIAGIKIERTVNPKFVLQIRKSTFCYGEKCIGTLEMHNYRKDTANLIAQDQQEMLENVQQIKKIIADTFGVEINVDKAKLHKGTEFCMTLPAQSFVDSLPFYETWIESIKYLSAHITKCENTIKDAENTTHIPTYLRKENGNKTIKI